MRPCPDCCGSGYGPSDIDGNDTDCPRCDGSGTLHDDDYEEYEDDEC